MFDSAIEHYKEAIRIRRELVEIDKSFKPKLADALNNLANAYYRKGLLDEAIANYKEALRIRRELVEIDRRYLVQLTTSLLLLGIASGTRNKDEDMLISRKLLVEARSMLEDSIVIQSPQCALLVELSKILNSIVCQE